MDSKNSYSPNQLSRRNFIRLSVSSLVGGVCYFSSENILKDFLLDNNFSFFDSFPQSAHAFSGDAIDLINRDPYLQYNITQYRQLMNSGFNTLASCEQQKQQWKEDNDRILDDARRNGMSGEYLRRLEEIAEMTNKLNTAISDNCKIFARMQIEFTQLRLDNFLGSYYNSLRSYDYNQWMMNNRFRTDDSTISLVQSVTNDLGIRGYQFSDIEKMSHIRSEYLTIFDKNSTDRGDRYPNAVVLGKTDEGQRPKIEESTPGMIKALSDLTLSQGRYYAEQKSGPQSNEEPCYIELPKGTLPSYNDVIVGKGYQTRNGVLAVSDGIWKNGIYDGKIVKINNKSRTNPEYLIA